jgi:hypothetical protein
MTASQTKAARRRIKQRNRFKRRVPIKEAFTAKTKKGKAK